MQLRLRVQQIMRNPLRVVLRKLAKKIALTATHSLRRRAALRQSSDPHRGKDLTIAPRLRSIPLNYEAKIAPLISEQCKSYMQNKFSFLGLRDQHCVFGVECEGIDGYRYDPVQLLQIGESAQWLQQTMRPVHVSNACRVWQLIQAPYSPIDWQRDYRSGYRWSEKQWVGDITIPYGRGIDAKIPWELGRMHHLVHLAQAYTFTSSLDERAELHRCYCNQVLDFIAQNPVGFGIQWKTPMDVSIRITNILVAYDIFQSSGASFGTNFISVLAQSAAAHAEYIHNNLEWSQGMRANHYLANVCGLVVVTSYLRGWQKRDEMLQFAIAQLIQELHYQFLCDGGNFEASISYHTFAASMVVWATAFALRSEYAKLISTNIEFVNKLSRVESFTRRNLYGNGSAPQIGDNDSGQFLSFFPDQKVGDITTSASSHLLSCFTALFGDVNPNSSCQFEHNLLRSLIPIPLERVKDESLSMRVTASDFGLYSYARSAYQCFVRAGAIGQRGKGGHAHNDQLSFTLAVGGIEIFCDPGTYVYTPLPEKRNHFRSSAMHNTLVINGEEQNDWSIGSVESLFWMNADRTRTRLLQSTDAEWSGEHYGYSSVHKRRFEFADKTISIFDYCETPKAKTVYFHVVPGVEIKPMSDGLCELQYRGVVLSIQFSEAQVAVNTCLYSPEYGGLYSTNCVEIRTHKTSLTTRITIVS